MIDLSASIQQELFIPSFQEKDLRFFVKRDDLIHPYISGNKWRKLSGIVNYAKKHNIEELLTFGGAFSNHLLATACAGAIFGFKTKGIVRGEEVQNHVLMLCRLYGMELKFIGRDEMGKLRTDRKELTAEGKTLLIPEGGNCPEGEIGCMEILKECKEEYDHVFVAIGTGTTIRGIKKSLPQGCLLHGVVVMKSSEFDSLEGDNTRIHKDYHFGGYAKLNPDVLRIAQEFARETGILLDPVYTAKLYAGILDLAEKSSFAHGQKILMIHSGGLTGWLGPKTPEIVWTLM